VAEPVVPLLAPLQVEPPVVPERKAEALVMREADVVAELKVWALEAERRSPRVTAFLAPTLPAELKLLAPEVLRHWRPEPGVIVPRAAPPPGAAAPGLAAE
jgi:hypothetical protein